MSHTLDLYFDECTCRDHRGQITKMGHLIVKLAKFKLKNPGENISKFLDDEGIYKICCRRTMISVWMMVLKSDLDKFLFRAANPPNLDYLNPKLPELEFPEA